MSEVPRGRKSQFLGMEDAFAEATRRDKELAQLRRTIYRNRSRVAVVSIDSPDNLYPNREGDELQGSPFVDISSDSIPESTLNLSHIVFLDDAMPGEGMGQVSIVSASEIGEVQFSVADKEDNVERRRRKVVVDQKRIDRIVEKHSSKLGVENIVFDPDSNSQMRQYLVSERFAKLRKLLQSEYSRGDMRNRIAGYMFEDMGHSILADLLGKTNLQLLSPEGAFEMWRYLYPHAKVVHYPLGKKSLQRIPVPDGLVVSRGLEGYRILSTVEYTLSHDDRIFSKALSFQETCELYPEVFVDEPVITAVVPKESKKLLLGDWRQDFISVQELPHITAREFGKFTRDVINNQLIDDFAR